MLAQNFMTPAELGLDDAEFRALVKVLGMLERKEIPEKKFDMDIVGKPDCGTPGCILGWAATVGFTGRLLARLQGNEKVVKLFLPGQDDCFEAYQSNTSQAALALRSFLTTGEPRWAQAMGIVD